MSERDGPCCLLTHCANSSLLLSVTLSCSSSCCCCFVVIKYSIMRSVMLWRVIVKMTDCCWVDVLMTLEFDVCYVFHNKQFDHVGLWPSQSAIVCWHWLRVPETIIFKIAVQTYHALHGDTPQYPRQYTPIADIPSRQRLRSSSSDDLYIYRTAWLDVAP